MGLTCSILGHDFDETTTERDRTESDNEVVIVERTVETCSRCGDTRVVAENKEVTAIETGDGATAASQAEEPTQQSASSAPTSTVPDARSDRSDSAGTGHTDDFQPPTDAAEDDGIILEDDEDTDDERAPGEWPGENDESGDSESSASEEDAEILTDDAAPDQPEESPVPTDKASAAGDPAEELDLGPANAGPATTTPTGGFRCPECGFETDADGASLRAGDYCPECHTGTLERVE